MFPKVPQSFPPESLGFPSYPLPLDTPPEKEPYNFFNRSFFHVPDSFFGGGNVLHLGLCALRWRGCFATGGGGMGDEVVNSLADARAGKPIATLVWKMVKASGES